MFAKGRTNYHAMVEDKAESLKLLLSIVPDYISDMRNKAEKSASSVSEEYTEWDEDAQKEVVRTWHPLVDTTIFDDMLFDFYASMMQRIYSYAEICMLGLCKDKKSAQEERSAYMDHPENEKISNLTFYYRKIQKRTMLHCLVSSAFGQVTGSSMMTVARILTTNYQKYFHENQMKRTFEEVR